MICKQVLRGNSMGSREDMKKAVKETKIKRDRDKVCHRELADRRFQEDK